MQNNKGSILIVDDNPTNLDVLFDYLDQMGFEIFVAEDGEAALEQMNYARPDLILLDALMPGLDGFETCHRLKNNPQTQEIPVIFMTALVDAADKIKGFQAGAVDYVTKPIQQEEILARVMTHLTLHRLQNQVARQATQLQQETARRQQAENQLTSLREQCQRFIQLLETTSDTDAATILHQLKTEFFDCNTQLTPDS